MSQINKAPPFLELSKSTIQNFDTNELDIENVLSIWTGLTKCSKFITNGKRLENMSWRIVNRNLVYSNQLRSAAANNSNDLDIAEVPLPGTYKPLKNKLNDADFMSLLAIVADQGLFTRPTLTKRKSSSKNLTIRNKSNESLNRPPMFRQASANSAKSLKKNTQKKKSSLDLLNMQIPPQPQPQPQPQNQNQNQNQPAQPLSTKIQSDSDLFEQPNPRLAFGILDNKTPDPPAERPTLVRADTNTSIIRGFDPNKGPDSPKKVQVSPTIQIKSLFGDSQQNNRSSIHSQKPASLFGNHPPQQNERVKSPLSQDSTQYFKAKQPQQVMTSLFQQSQQSHPKVEHHPQPQRPKTLFEQVGISPELQKTLPSKSKRKNVLNNLGMTSLTSNNHSAHQKSQDKKMFFIESSPSPNESVSKFLGEKHNVNSENGRSAITPHQKEKTTPSLFGDHQSSHGSNASSTNSHQHRALRTAHPLQTPQVKPEHLRIHQNDRRSSRENSNKSVKKKSVSLFGDNLRQIEFASDSDSISDESDWASVSESDDEEYNNMLREQWEKLDFKRREANLAKPPIKRSLLSGLFLNEMDPGEPSHHHPHGHHGHHLQNQDKHQPQAHFSKSEHTTPAESELGSSVSSNVHIKHRHVSNSDALEVSTAAASQSVISASHVNATGLVNEPHRDEPYIEKHTDLKAKLSEHDSATQHSSSFTNLISKSALNLTTYFGQRRKNSFSSIATDRSRLKFKHESNAPPTASTILPTALSTHMFLPNAHQRAKSKLAAVTEDSFTVRDQDDDRLSMQPLDSAIASVDEDINVPPPVIPPPNKSVTLREAGVGGGEGVDLMDLPISGRLSPKTTRRQMLATELSESLRNSILWDRKHTYPANGIKPELKSLELKESKRSHKKKELINDYDRDDNYKQADRGKTKADHLQGNRGVSTREMSNATTTTMTSDDASTRLNDKFMKEINDNNNWSEEEEDNFYTRGW